MKKVFVFALALMSMSCTNGFVEEIEELEEVQEVKKTMEVNEDYKTMYDFVDWICYYEDLFGLKMPSNPSYDELMSIAASVIVTDTFADTLGECNCEKVYLLMLDYFTSVENTEMVDFLKLILMTEYDIYFDCEEEE